MKKYLYKDLYLFEEDHWWHRTKRLTYLSLMRNYLKNNANRVLDVGCGTGLNVETLAKEYDSYGIDSSVHAINFCKKRKLSNVSVQSASKTSFKSNSFDGVIILDVLEHIEDDSSVVKELYRILKPNGICIITVPAFPQLWSRWDEELLHKRRYTKKTLTSLLTRHSLKIEKISYQYVLLVVPVFLIRKAKDALYKNRNYPSDFTHSNPLVNSLLGYLFALELKLLLRMQIPFGTSLVCVVRKMTKPNDK